jgi:glycine/D-amino acid oxidase-like deaminating enzyme
VEGVKASLSFMRARFPDWSAEGTSAVLHEVRSGWADAGRTLEALAGIARVEGVSIFEGVEVVGFDLNEGGVASVETTSGSIQCEVVVVAPGPWARDLWRMLNLDDTVRLGESTEPVFHYWGVREGEFLHAEAGLDANAPVVHLDVDRPLISTGDGTMVLESPWGIYFRPSVGGAIACGGLPVALEPEVQLDPYGPSHAVIGQADPSFDRSSSIALAWALARFRDRPHGWQVTSFVAPTCFTPDSYPIVGFVRDNVYVVVDSNHGFKLLALGKLAATEIVNGEPCAELDPFRMDRFSLNATHPTSSSPYPWT